MGLWRPGEKESFCFAINKFFFMFVNTGITKIAVLICTRIGRRIVILLILFQRNLKHNGISF